MNRARAVLTALVLLSALVLGGCADDEPEPKFAAPSSEPPESPSTTAAAAPMTPAKTVRAWVKAQNLAMATGDSSAVRALSSADCETCEGLIDPIDKVTAAGGRFETEGWTVDRAKEVESAPTGSTVRAAVTIADGRTFNSAGADPVSYEMERSILEFRLVPAGDGWSVTFIGFLS